MKSNFIKKIDNCTLVLDGFDEIAPDATITLKIFGDKNNRIVVVPKECTPFTNRVIVKLNDKVLNDKKAVEYFDTCSNKSDSIRFIKVDNEYYQTETI